MKEITFIPPMDNKLKKELEINYGIQILRLCLSYLILQFHCYNQALTKNKLLIFLVQSFHFYVPTFYIISFYFSYKKIKVKNIYKIKLRLKRIFIPYIIWPSLFFIMNNINIYIPKEQKYRYKDLFIQFLTGKRIYDSFWYLCNLILTNILFSIISLLTENNFLICIQLIGIAGSLYYSYHYYNNLFINYIIEISSLIKDFSKVLFYGAIGITLSSIKAIKTLINYRKRVVCFCIYILYLIRDFQILKESFLYLRCLLFGIGSTILFILFAILPLENIKNKTIHIFIINLTKYSGGIYYLHLKIRELLYNKILLIKNGNLVGCFLIYIISYFISFLGKLFFGKTNLKFLFY